MIPQPKNQVQEVLYLLLKNHKYGGVTRVGFMRMAYVMNAPEAISKLRKRGVHITTTIKTLTNKFGSKVKIATYQLDDYDDAERKYRSMQSNSQPVTG